MMKKVICRLMIITTIYASAENHIELGVGVLSVKDNFTYIEDKRVSSLANSPKKQELAIPVFSLEYNGFFIGVGDNLEGIGYRHDFGDISVAVGVDSYEVFENPYLLNKNRKHVDAQEITVSLSGNYAEFLEYSVDYSHIEVEDKVAKDAQQSANEVNLGVYAVLLPLSQNAYMGLGYDFTYHNSKGKSNTHYKNGVSFFTIIKLTSDYRLTGEVGYEKYMFNSQNSYFNKKRNEKGFSIGSELMADNLFNNKNSYLQMVLFYGKRDSNINFFDTEYVGGSLSYGYMF